MWGGASPAPRFAASAVYSTSLLPAGGLVTAPLLPPVQDRRRCLAAALQQLTRLYPADVDREKTLLLLTLLVAKKVADHSPAVLQDVFHTTVTFINQNLLAYVRNLVQNVRASGGSSWALNPRLASASPHPGPL